MSGGHFDYVQHNLDDVVEEMNRLIYKNSSPNEYGYANNFSQETLNEFVNTIRAVKLARVYVQRVDWLVSGDDGENTFHEKLKEDIINVQDW